MNTILFMQDLQELSEGLEGRSSNQLALLMDTLLLPNADIGESNSSTLHWKFDKSKHISHVVIGNGQPGGSWHGIKGEIQSLSLGSWLELPEYSFEEWAAHSGGNRSHDISSKRVTLSTVAEYYQDYVVKMGLQNNMINDVRVTKAKVCPSPIVCTIGSPKSCVSPQIMSPCPSETASPSCLPMHTVDSGLILRETECSFNKVLDLCCDSLSDYSGSSDSEDDGVCCGKKSRDYKWCLKGAGKEGDVIVRAKNLVLACGVGGSPRQLGVDGEDAAFVFRRFSDFCQKLESLDYHLPVVIVGAGLSAADAVLLCLKKRHKVVHIFHQDPHDSSLIYNKMPATLYPEYRHLLQLMKGEQQDELYLPASRSKVTNFTSGNFCTYENHEGKETSLLISLTGVFIGSEASLDFLPRKIRTQLAVDPSLPINAKTNPVDVDPLTFESESCPSLYALGPLVGDHFVRFVLGSGLGVCRHLVDKLL